MRAVLLAVTADLLTVHIPVKPAVDRLLQDQHNNDGDDDPEQFDIGSLPYLYRRRPTFEP